MFPEVPRPFNTQYKCFSVSMMPGNDRQDVERGGKIIMPPSALDTLTRLHIVYPMLFKLTNKKTDRMTHSGVLEFVADEGKVYLPYWMMHNLLLQEGDLLNIECVSLPVATYACFQPQSEDFLDITNPKAVLENGLRSFACLTAGDMIAIKYNSKIYEMCVLKTEPGSAVTIIECDMNVEFAPPVGYKEPEKPQPKEEDKVHPADLMPEPTGFIAFKGSGNRLDGKKRKDSSQKEFQTAKPTYVRGIPDYEYNIGTLSFLRNIMQINDKEEKTEEEVFQAFTGEGFSLRKPRK
ncbi:hypothetical protein TKK_0018748 [Trichogramma kaykai]|uniref:Ubiquitin fusion degradation protein 1 homolog n=1 Tax=Trichogramma kaykai TaxID=54128 RepID=A0ABD2VXT1_9HYME